MPSFGKRVWHLGIALFVSVLAGCASPDTNVAEVTDPFAATAVTIAGESPASHARWKRLPPVASPADAEQPRIVSMASFESDARRSDRHVLPTVAEVLLLPADIDESLTIPQLAAPDASGKVVPGAYPIDLANALRLGGADDLQVRLARTRLYQAQARYLEARALWLPSLRFGVSYHKHDGQLQETEGNVLEINRNSLFYGGGLGLGEASLAAGASGPARLTVNLSLADAYFKPLAACQETAAFGAAEQTAVNDSLARIADAYHRLVEAHSQYANAAAARDMAENMVRLVENFEREGFSSMTEVYRARAELGRWQRDAIEAQRQITVRSAELARLLRLPPQLQLLPAEEVVFPVDFVEASTDIDDLIAMALTSRPEIRQYAALREAARFRLKEEHWQPWIPYVQVGTSVGGFGGGPSTQFPQADDRSDVDVSAVWEWKNLGLGNVALLRQRRGELNERLLELEVVRERIAAEVVAVAADVAGYREQMEVARESISAAEASYQLNEQRIRESEGLPIEFLQSIAALTDARNAYTEAVANYNRAQFRLLRAIGSRVEASPLPSVGELPSPIDGP